jgi:hypothetical protein
MDWMGLEKIEKKFDLFGIQTHPIPLNPHGLRANRTRPKLELIPHDLIFLCMHFFLETLQSYALGCMHACMSRHGHMLDCPSTHTWAFLDDEYS